jgi:hypothetical protein
MVDNMKESKKLIEHIDDVSLSVLHSDLNAAKGFLKECGINSDEELSFGMQHLKQTEFLMKAKFNQRRDAKLLEDAFLSLKESIRENSAHVGNILRDMLYERSAAVQYRKLEEWSDNEIREVLNDLDLVTLLEKLDEEK